ncbi:hypothetical protein Tco_1245278 [Tanacetum coccineum]
MVYRRVEKGEPSNNNIPPVEIDNTKSVDSSQQGKGMELKNSFASLGDVEEELWTNASVNDSVALNVINESDSEDVDEELVVEEDRRNVATDNTTKGASTPVTEGIHD